MASPPSSRLAYIDWMRGLACLLMFQTHAYDSWLSPAARQTTFFMWSQLLGTFPAPLFLFLAGISSALVVDRLRQKGVAANQIARTTMTRGLEIWGLGLAFRLQEYLIAFPWAPWTDLFRVDILNMLGLAMILMGVVARLAAGGKGTEVARARALTTVAAVAVALAIALLTPPLWTTWRPRFLAWPLESYINGVHFFDQPQAWLFPIFPWVGFAFAGMATGLALFTDWARRHQGAAVALAGAGGLALIQGARWLEAQPAQLYAVHDFWHTSPNFFLIRVGLLLVILLGCYAWCRWGLGTKAFSPVIQLGQTSLLIYWVHIEFVYGRFSILPKHAQSIRGASLGLATIILAMLGLSLLRTRVLPRMSRWPARRSDGSSAS
ncbi:MAG: heparan-alpha-glucosaminide N-acetyltransferase domain-containing protein [Terriglobales bacterium]